MHIRNSNYSEAGDIYHSASMPWSDTRYRYFQTSHQSIVENRPRAGERGDKASDRLSVLTILRRKGRKLRSESSHFSNRPANNEVIRKGKRNGIQIDKNADHKEAFYIISLPIDNSGWIKASRKRVDAKNGARPNRSLRLRVQGLPSIITDSSEIHYCDCCGRIFRVLI